MPKLLETPVLEHEPGKLIIKLMRGYPFDETFIKKDNDYQPIDLLGYTANMHVRETLQSPVIRDDLSTANGRIILNNPLGGINILISEAVLLANYTLDNYVYDFRLINALGVPELLFEGTMPVSSGVTR